MLKSPHLLKMLAILLGAVALQVASYSAHPAVAVGSDVARLVLLVGALAFLLSALPGTQHKPGLEIAEPHAAKPKTRERPDRHASIS